MIFESGYTLLVPLLWPVQLWVALSQTRLVSLLPIYFLTQGIRSLLDTVMQALPQVGNLGLLFFLLFFIFAALGVELFGRLGNILNIYILVLKH